VPLQATVVAGLDVRVQVLGARVSASTLRTLLPIYEEGAVDEDLLQEGRRNLRDFLQRDGYFDAEVNYTTETQQDPPATQQPAAEMIVYRVELGSRHRLVGFGFAGNHYFNQDLLRSRVRIQPGGLASPGRFSSDQLSSDVASLTELYQANGFREAQVKGELMDTYQGRQGSLFVNFDIQEGRQTRIGQLIIQGNQALKQPELLAVTGSTAGQPFSDVNVTGDRDNILALYFDQGFPDAQFRASVEDMPPAGNAEGPRVKLTYQIEEGRQLRVAQVLFGGYEHTRRSVIVREVQLQPGLPLSEGSVVETQRRLYNLGIFSRVAIAPQNPNGANPQKTVDVLVDEARQYTIGYGLGLEVQRLGSASAGPTAQPLRFSPRGTFEFAKLNLTGRADTLSFKARASTLQGRALLSYTSSNHFGRPNMRFQVTGIYDKTRDVLTFTSTRAEGSLQLTQTYSPSTTFLYRFVYRRVLASDLQVAAQEIPLFNQPTQVSFFSFTWLRDRRDDAADPSSGSFNTFNVDLASKSIGSGATFLRSSFQNSTYTRIGRRLVFARSSRFGILEPLDKNVPALDCPVSNPTVKTGCDIPLPERFFAGGGTTLRGFGLNQAGPRDPETGFPVGGLALLAFNQQLQFPLRLPFLGSKTSGGIFYDAGNVFQSISHVTLRYSPPAPITNELNYFSHTVGFEFRYRTPIGPVSIDLGYQLNPARFVLPVNAAQPSGAVTVSRLPAFQFFVNLGSTF